MKISAEHRTTSAESSTMRYGTLWKNLECDRGSMCYKLKERIFFFIFHKILQEGVQCLPNIINKSVFTYIAFPTTFLHSSFHFPLIPLDFFDFVRLFCLAFFSYFNSFLFNITCIRQTNFLAILSFQLE